MKIFIRIISVIFIAVGAFSISFLIIPGAAKGLGVCGPFFLLGGIGTFLFKKWGRLLLTLIMVFILLFFGFIALTLVKDLEVTEYGSLASLGAILVCGGLFLVTLFNPKANELFK